MTCLHDFADRARVMTEECVACLRQERDLLTDHLHAAQEQIVTISKANGEVAELNVELQLHVAELQSSLDRALELSHQSSSQAENFLQQRIDARRERDVARAERDALRVSLREVEKWRDFYDHQAQRVMSDRDSERRRADLSEARERALRETLERETVTRSAERSWCTLCRTETPQPHQHQHAPRCPLSLSSRPA